MSYSTGVFPVYSNGRNIGSVTISQEGLLTAFECYCAHDGALAMDSNSVPRLAALCSERFVPLGVMIPQGSSLRLKRKFSKSALQAMGYSDTKSFVLVTKAQLDAAQNAAATMALAPAEPAKAPPPVEPAEKPPAEAMTQAPPPSAKDAPVPIKEAEQKGASAPSAPLAAPPPKDAPAPAKEAPAPAKEAPAPVKEAPAPVKNAPAPPSNAQRAPLRRMPEAQKAPPPGIMMPGFMGGVKTAPSSAPKEAPNNEKVSLNTDSVHFAPETPTKEPESKKADLENIIPEKPLEFGAFQQSPEQNQGVSSANSAPSPKTGASASASPESDTVNAPQGSLNDASKLVEALAPALGTILSALNAQKSQEPAEKAAPEPAAPPASPPKETDAQQGIPTVEKPAAPQSAPPQAAPDVKGDLSAAAEPPSVSADKDYDKGVAAAAFSKAAAEEPDEGEEAEVSVLEKPLIGGWRPAPPLSKLFEDPTIYEDRETVPGALVTEQDGFTLLAVPVSPEEPFALMSIFCFGYPTQIAEKDYILFKINDGVLAL